MQKLSAITIATAVTLSTASFGANAQILGIMHGISSVFGQVSTKLADKLTGASQAKDIQAEREKLFSSLEAQTAGMDAASKTQLHAEMEKSWAMAEHGMLVHNAKLQKSKNGPLIDFKQVARDSVGGIASDLGMGAVYGGESLGSVLTSATLDGVADGMGGTGSSGSASQAARKTRAHALSMGKADLSGMAAANMNNMAAQAVSATVSKAVSGLAGSGSAAQSTSFEVAESVHPLLFSGKHPSELASSELYRENGFLGFKRIES